MRWVFIVLLMLNGIYYTWQHNLADSGYEQQKVEVGAARASNNSLVLLAEAPNDIHRENESEVDTTIDVLPKVGTTIGTLPEDDMPMCWMVGPFDEADQGKAFAARMAALDIMSSVVTKEVEGPPDYWVHIPSRATRDAALALLRELKARKIDSFLISKGELENGISLGLFSREHRAQAVYDQRKAQGYAVEVQVVPRQKTQIWLVSDQGGAGKMSDEHWEMIKKEESGLKRHKNYCNKIASSEKLE